MLKNKLIEQFLGCNSNKIAELCSLELIVPSLKPIQEKDLKTLVDFEAVVSPRILLTDGGYIFVFHLREKHEIEAQHGAKVATMLFRTLPLSEIEGSELFSLYGIQKRRPRTWRSMDRMIRWFSERGLLAASVALQVTTPVPVHISTPTPRSSS